jgi:hypothetical protein
MSSDGKLSVLTKPVTVRAEALQADVYLIAAGRRFGVLDVVHTPGSPFAIDRVVADWMNTIQGVSPWGAPDAGELHANCPTGFQTRPAEAPRTVARCIAGVGTDAFTMISLTWDEGGLGDDSDRQRLATQFAQRIASTQGAAARVIDGPIPFTLARNVDSIRTRVATAERMPVVTRVLAATAPSGSQRVLGIGSSPDDSEAVTALSSLFQSSGALREPSWLNDHRAWAISIAAMILGAAVTVSLLRRVRNSPSPE